MRLIQLVAFTSGMFFVSAMFAQSKPAVEQQWAEGKYIVVVKSFSKQSGRKEGPSSTEVEESYELLVQKPAAKGQKIQVTFNRLRHQYKGGGLEGFSRDTDKPAGEDRYSAQTRFKAMIGMPMVTTIGTDGKIGEISGIDEIVKKAGAADDPMGADTVVALCKTSLTSSLAPLLFHFPGEPVVKGYAWTRNDPMELGVMGALKMTQNYKVKSVEDTPGGRVAAIDFSAKNASDKPGATDEDSAKWMKIVPIDEVTWQIAGTVKVNLDTKMLISEKLHTKTTMKGTSLMDGGNLPFNFVTERDSEVVVTPEKSTPTSSTRPG